MRNLRLDSVTIVLIVVCAFTAAMALISNPLESSWEEHTGENGTVRNKGNKKEIGSPRSNVPVNTSIADYSEILKRPLFDSSRRPKEEVFDDSIDKVHRSPVALAPKQDLLLIGIIIVGGDQIALLQTKGSRAIERVQVGDLIEGWLVVSLSKSTVTMKRGKEIKALEIARNSDPRFAPRTPKMRRR
ncbi:MAG TPA: hypothetical protein DGR97_06045 [Gammaproteobacteria bacterium]|nr:hypothetical protein [Gammaproteobacteria bacterium]|tara:strand:- start:1018 stop:1578 length:561 start_codon:yes stop_codon:yes gene_type:complete